MALLKWVQQRHNDGPVDLSDQEVSIIIVTVTCCKDVLGYVHLVVIIIINNKQVFVKPHINIDLLLCTIV